MSKKKKAGAQSVVRSAAQIYNNTLQRFEKACDLMIGPGQFGKIVNSARKQMVEHRPNAVKLVFKPGSLGDADHLKHIQEIFTLHFSNLNFTNIRGAEMPVALFLREGLGLIMYSGAMKNSHVPGMVGVGSAFEAYNVPDWLTKPVSELVFLLHKMSIVLSDWSKMHFVYSVKGLVAYDVPTSDNLIVAEFRKPDCCMVKFDGVSREAVRLSWSGVEGDVEYCRVAPSAIGFRSIDKGIVYDVYIQRHAVQRLEERLGLNVGLVQHTIFELLQKDDLACFRQGPSSLVRLMLWDKKLGYLVCGLFEEKIVIRSFLFLTNDGTPEGKKLSELTQLQRLDKKYLEIDSLAGFLGMNVGEDPVLSDLFTEAGCADLLDLSEIKMYYMTDIKERDPARLLSYMLGKVETGELVEELN